MPRLMLVSIVAALAVVSCDVVDSLTAVEDPGTMGGANCVKGNFKCTSPTLKDGTVCFNAGNYDADYTYVCVKPDGTLANGIFGFLEDLSAYANRNNITCVSKLKCERL